MRRLTGRLLAAAVVVLAALTGCGADRTPVGTSATVTSGRPGAASAAASTPPPGGTAPGSSSRVAGSDPESGLSWVAESALPAQARQTLALIRAGGPYPYPRNDDQTFGNREGLLPAKPAPYYKEYTVVTPGQSDRGPRRIIAGRGRERYYTDDHYQSFRRIREGT